MKYVKKNIWVFLFFVMFLSLFTTQAQDINKQSQFITNYNIEYNNSPTGQTLVTQNISITNQQKDVVATDYSIVIRDMKIFDVTVESKQDNPQVEVIEENNSTKIVITFKDKVIGLNKTNEFVVKYNTFDIANNIGNIWSINIPKANLLPTTNEYNVVVRIPQQYGKKLYLSPKPNDSFEEQDEQIYSYVKDQLIYSGISGAFGEYQILDFKLNYELFNESHFTIAKQIAIPTDVKNFQQIAYKSINPKPNELFLDEDNNLIAIYNIKPKQLLNVDVSGSAQISGKQITPEFGGNTTDIPPSLVSNYTKEDKYWEVNSEEIQNLANQLYDPTLTVSQNAQLAYEFTTKYLQYGLDESSTYSQRRGAINALVETTNIGCMEYTDLLISILRAMNIPARSKTGYAVVNNNTVDNPLSITADGSSDKLHSWVEFYDPKFEWVQVDPTWGSTSGIDYFTKLDTNHLTFVTNGISSQKPIPAGMYNFTEGKKQVNVQVSSSSDASDFDPKLIFHKGPKINLIAFLRGQTNYDVENVGYTIVNIKNGNKIISILPNEYKNIFISNNQDKAVILSPNKDHDINITYSGEYISNVRKFTLVFPFLVVLGLCMIGYYLIIRKQAHKTLLLHLHRLPQVLDRLPNQR